ncbi:MAG TPA: glycosyltransferase family 4 protein [Sphingomicrobium sp.]|nr:glycosyltransferase family 4 protein [Sphingomicrobium sp.]
MRIAYVINSVEGGGAALPVPHIASALRNIGAQVSIFALTGRDRRALPAIVSAGLEVEVRANGEKDHLAALRWLDRAIVEYQPDVIWTSLTRATLLGQLVGLFQGIPVVSWQHAAFLRPVNRFLLRRMKNQSVLWVADSEAVTAFTVRELGVSCGDIITWPLFAADPGAPQGRPWMPGERIRIGSLGRLHPVKGYDVLIEALALIQSESPQTVPDITVTIAGEGQDRSRLTDLLAQTGLENVAFSGFCAQPRDFLSGLHLYLQPSRSEGFCVAAHEAMQAGLPVIGSTVGEIANSIVGGVTGELVPPGDARALASAILKSVSSPARLKGMGDAGRCRLLSIFSDEEFRRGARRIVERLEQLCRESQPTFRQGIDRSV